MKFEILAPAGSMESLIAGVRSGANAVYLGGKLFNARRNAGNFDNEELKKAVEYCHNRMVKVYLAINILISDREMQDAYNAVRDALLAGVDAFIIQDTGLAKMIREHFPEARLHASTQMSIMTPAGARFAKSLGFDRIVLPREMTLDEIIEMKNSTDMELELFVHGALCMSVSGQCYLSSILGSRSGNRGLCAQPCRLPFTAKGDRNECALSLKDLSLIRHLNKLDGVTSLKIEGRMKRPEYVSAAVAAVKKAIESAYSDDDEYLLRSVFSRSGFTDGYLTGKRGREMFGTRQKEDVISAENVLKKIAKNYEREVPVIAADMKFRCKKGEQCSLTVSAAGKTAEVATDIPETAVNKPMTAESVRARLSKLGGTPFYAGEIDIELDDGLILPASKINDLRRKAVEELQKTSPIKINAKPFEAKSYKEKNCKPYYTASFRDAKQIPDKHPFAYVFIPIDSTLEDFIDNRAGVVLPRGLFGTENDIRKRLEKLKKAGISKALCGNYGSYLLAKELGFEVFGDFGLNIFNSESAGLIDNPILSFELTLNQSNRISAENTGVIVYGRLPLMLTRNCPVKESVGHCKNKRNCMLTDRKGLEFPVICSDFPCVEILNSVPLCLSDKMSDVKTDFAHFMFTTESQKEVEHIINIFENQSSPDFKFTRGLSYRAAK